MKLALAERSSRQPASTQGVVRWSGNAVTRRIDTLVVEEPLEIRLAGYSVTVTMRTPGNDFELAAGFLFTEGILGATADIASIVHCEADDPASQCNIVNVNPTDPAVVDPTRWQRNFAVTSSCGICGKASITAIRQRVPAVASSIRIVPEILYQLGPALQDAQNVFEQTGGLHAAALFDGAGHLLCLREDVGRHNAVDKVIGSAFLGDELPLDAHILMVSGRASFEIVQKALMAGVPIVAAVSAPSSLAVDLARSCGMTLLGFLRDEHCNVYSGAERVGYDLAH